MLKVVFPPAYDGTEVTVFCCEAVEPAAPYRLQKMTFSPLAKRERASPEIVTVVPLMEQ